MKSCIFNLSGVLVDKFYIMNTHCLFKTFDKCKFVIPHNIYNESAHFDSKYMIQNIFLENSLLQQWYLKNNEYPMLEIDSSIYNNMFNESLLDEIEDNLLVNDKSKFIINYVKSKNYNVGVTSNYNYNITNTIVNKLSNQNIEIDYFSFYENYKLRNNPYQIYDNIINLKSEDVKNIIVIDNTLEGVKRGLKSGCKTIAVVDGSPLMNIFTKQMLGQYDRLELSHPNSFQSVGNYNRYYYEYQNKIKKCKQKFNEIGCEHIIDDLSDLQYLI